MLSLLFRLSEDILQVAHQKQDLLVDSLISWFFHNKRDLPWRRDKTPYRVWVSEIMLQQTRVSVVIPYYLRWIERFPTIKMLAEAPEEEVIKLWEGLGYYSRARNLQKGARYIVEQLNGNLPNSRSELLKIPGIGSYTAGAILSFGFGKPSPALDGNVKRVLSRILLFEKEANKHAKELENYLSNMLPKSEIGADVMEALIELGALVCQKRPACDVCPLRERCRAFKNGNPEKLPLLPERKKTIRLHRSAICLIAKNKVLLKKEKKGNLMGGLWQFPFYESNVRPELSESREYFSSALSLPLSLICPLPTVVHYFTRYKSFVFPFICETPHAVDREGYNWIPLKELTNLAFCSGHRQIVKSILYQFRKITS